MHVHFLISGLIEIDVWKQEGHSHDSPTPTTTTWKEWQAQFGGSTGFELRSAAASMTSSTQRGQASREDIVGTIGITGREWREVFVPWLRNDAAYADSVAKDTGAVSSTVRPQGQRAQQRFVVAPAGMAVMLPFPQERYVYGQNTQTKKQPNVQSKQTNATCS